MADKKISELTELTTLSDTDVVPIVETAVPETKKTTWLNIKAKLKTYFDSLYLAVSTTTASISDSVDKRYCTDAQKAIISRTSGINSGDETAQSLGLKIDGSTEVTTSGVLDNCDFALDDQNDGSILKNISYTRLKSIIKAYFDTLYSPLRYAAYSTTQQTGFSSATYIKGSCVTVPVGSIIAGSRYRCRFDITKTAAGTGYFSLQVKAGSSGTISDANLLNTGFSNGTAAADEGIVTLDLLFRTGGANASGRVLVSLMHELAATGLTTEGGAGVAIKTASIVISDLSAETKIGVAMSGNTSFAGTIEFVSAEFIK